MDTVEPPVAVAVEHRLHPHLPNDPVTPIRRNTFSTGRSRTSARPASRCRDRHDAPAEATSKSPAAVAAPRRWSPDYAREHDRAPRAHVLADLHPPVLFLAPLRLPVSPRKARVATEIVPQPAEMPPHPYACPARRRPIEPRSARSSGRSLRLVVIPTRSPRPSDPARCSRSAAASSAGPSSPEHRDADRLEPDADVLVRVIVSSDEHDLAAHTVNRQLLNAPCAKEDAQRHRHGDRRRPASDHAAPRQPIQSDPALSSTQCSTAPARRDSRRRALAHAHGPASATLDPFRFGCSAVGRSSRRSRACATPHGPTSQPDPRPSRRGPLRQPPHDRVFDRAARARRDRGHRVGSCAEGQRHDVPNR